MKFLIGSQNFGLDLPDSDRDYMEFYYPELQDLCKAIPTTKEHKNEDGTITKKVDIRALPNLFYKSNLDTLQLLYSKEVDYDSFVKELFDNNKEELSTINLPRFYQSIMGSAINRFKKGTSKDLAHIIFGFKTLVQFEEQGLTNLEKCFNHNENGTYQVIREGDYNDWLEIAKEWEKHAFGKKESYMNQKPNDEFMLQLEQEIAFHVVSNFIREEKM